MRLVNADALIKRIKDKHWNLGFIENYLLEEVKKDIIKEIEKCPGRDVKENGQGIYKINRNNE